ncbi:hypothetical protein D3C76_1465840 [compost metagenome]
MPTAACSKVTWKRFSLCCRRDWVLISSCQRWISRAREWWMAALSRLTSTPLAIRSPHCTRS